MKVRIEVRILESKSFRYTVLASYDPELQRRYAMHCGRQEQYGSLIYRNNHDSGPKPACPFIRPKTLCETKLLKRGLKHPSQTRSPPADPSACSSSPSCSSCYRA